MVGRRFVLKAHTSFSLGFSWAGAGGATTSAAPIIQSRCVRMRLVGYAMLMYLLSATDSWKAHSSSLTVHS